MNMLDTTLTDNTSLFVKMQHFLGLCKLKVIALISFTTFVGMLLASEGMAPLQPLIFGLIGISMAAASGAAINHVVDFHIDAIMARTRKRPLPQAKLTQQEALVFALALAFVSMIILVLLVNPLTAALTFIALIGYAVVYTMYLKRSTPMNIVWGGAAGAAPPLLGWAAMTGEVNQEALLLFLIIFIWTPPHFWALAIKRRDEYAKANIPMLPVTHGIQYTKMHILLYTVLLLTVSLLPFLIHMSGVIYLMGAVSLGIIFIYHAWRLYTSEGDEHAMKTFAFSIFYLSSIFGFLLVDHYARILLRFFLG